MGRRPQWKDMSIHRAMRDSCRRGSGNGAPLSMGALLGELGEGLLC